MCEIKDLLPELQNKIFLYLSHPLADAIKETYVEKHINYFDIDNTERTSICRYYRFKIGDDYKYIKLHDDEEYYDRYRDVVDYDGDY